MRKILLTTNRRLTRAEYQNSSLHLQNQLLQNQEFVVVKPRKRDLAIVAAHAYRKCTGMADGCCFAECSCNLQMYVFDRQRIEVACLRMSTQIDEMYQLSVALLHESNFHEPVRVRDQLGLQTEASYHVMKKARVGRQTQAILQRAKIPRYPRHRARAHLLKEHPWLERVFLIDMHEFRRSNHGWRYQGQYGWSVGF